MELATATSVPTISVDHYPQQNSSTAGVSPKGSYSSRSGGSPREKIEIKKRKLAEDLLNDPPALKASRVIKIREACLSSSTEEVRSELPWQEKFRNTAISVIESRTALNAIGTLFFSGLSLSVAAAVTDFKLNPVPCSLPKAPLALSIASAILTLIAGGMEILGSKIKHEAKHLAQDDDALVKKFIEALESRKAEAQQGKSGPVGHLHEKIKECIQDFNGLPEELKKELPSPELWTLWLLNTLPEEHPLRTSSELLKDSGSLSLTGAHQETVAGLVEEMIATSTVFSIAASSAPDVQTSAPEKKVASKKGPVIINVVGDSVLENNKRKLAEHLMDDPSRLKTARIQAQADRLRELQIEKESHSSATKRRFLVKLLKSKKRRLVEKVLIASSILLSSAATITDLVINDTNVCERSIPAIAMNGASIGLLSVVSLIWMGYQGLKTSIDEKQHEEDLVEKFVKAVEEHTQAARNIQPDQVEALQEKIRQCLELFDKLPDDLKEELPPRDIWILGLLNALPESHPIRPALQAMRSMSGGLKSRSKSQRKSVSLVVSASLQAEFEKIFVMIEEIVGSPIHFLAAGDICVTRDYQIKTLEETMKMYGNCQTSDAGGISIGINTV